MVRHIVAWNYKEGFSDSENKENAEKIKSELEALPRLIDGIIEMKVYIYSDLLSSGNRNIVLNSLFKNEEALAAYIIHPEHKRAGEFVRSVTQDRASVDYIE